MHGSSGGGVVIGPHLKIVDTLERFIRAQNQAADIATDVLKTSLPTEECAIRGEAATNRVRYLDKR